MSKEVSRLDGDIKVREQALVDLKAAQPEQTPQDQGGDPVFEELNYTQVKGYGWDQTG